MKENKGITLIAMIITIVILLILLAVSIDLIIDGKIFTSAEKAVNGTNEKVAQQQGRVDELMEILNNVEQKQTEAGKEDEIIEFEWEEVNGTIRLTKYIGTNPNVTIPTTIQKKKVTTIGEKCFWNETENTGMSIEGVVIPSTITLIEENAFYSCRSLRTVTFKEGFNGKISGDTENTGAFRSCTVLTTISFNDDFSGEIGSYALLLVPWLEDKVVKTWNTWDGNVSINGKEYFLVYDTCFVIGTKVLTPNGYLNIENIKIGDMVLSKNEKTNEIEAKEVTKTFEHNYNGNTYKIFTENSNVEATYNHPFYVKNQGWIEAKDLKEGNILINADNEELKIQKIEIIKNIKDIKVYNLQVKDNHTCFVGLDKVLVHNKW